LVCFCFAGSAFSPLLVQLVHSKPTRQSVRIIKRGLGILFVFNDIEGEGGGTLSVKGISKSVPKFSKYWAEFLFR